MTIINIRIPTTKCFNKGTVDFTNFDYEGFKKPTELCRILRMMTFLKMKSFGRRLYRILEFNRKKATKIISFSMMMGMTRHCSLSIVHLQ